MYEFYLFLIGIISYNFSPFFISFFIFPCEIIRGTVKLPCSPYKFAQWWPVMEYIQVWKPFVVSAGASFQVSLHVWVNLHLPQCVMWTKLHTGLREEPGSPRVDSIYMVRPSCGWGWRRKGGLWQPSPLCYQGLSPWPEHLSSSCSYISLQVGRGLRGHSLTSSRCEPLWLRP